MKNEEILTNKEDIKIYESEGRNILKFTNASDQHVGKYTCIAENQYGTTSTEFEFEVGGRCLISELLFFKLDTWQDTSLPCLLLPE